MVLAAVVAVSVLLLSPGCADRESDAVVLTADLPLHLEDHLDAATIEGSEVPADLSQAVEWRFDEPQPDWKPVVPLDRAREALRVARTDDALRVMLTEGTGIGIRRLAGGIYVELPDWRREDWAYVLVRARTSEDIERLTVEFNLNQGSRPAGLLFRFRGESVDVINDGTVHTYQLRTDWSGGQWEGPWRQLGLLFVGAEEPASIDLVSVSVIPKEADYAAAPAGVRTEVRSRAYRRALYMHASARLAYRVRVPEDGRLDVGLGTLRDDVPVTFRITARSDNSEAKSLFQETYADKEHWAQRSVDLSSLAGHTVTLALEADAEKDGTVALWAAPTLTGVGAADTPNVIFYVIDGAGADHMSLFGYNRRTTPNLERLAAEGAVFERAYSNSSWTLPSTASFMTSLQHSVLGGLEEFDPIPEQAGTMAEHMHGAGYQTAVFVANPNAGTVVGLERGVDVFQEDWEEFTYFGGENHAESSRVLHEAFWTWREAYPGTPYWVHFQTTDVHRRWQPVAPFAGLFVTPDVRQILVEWHHQLEEAGGRRWYRHPGPAFEKTGISRVAYFDAARGLYDETMAHQDYQIGRLVERLKAQGEWERTLLIVGADHSTLAAGGEFSRGMLDSLPPLSGPMFRSSVTRVPLIMVWPGRIPAGERFSQPVSMIDVLPTVLDLVGVPQFEVMQGHSLVPLLLGEEGWEPRPVILDEFYVDQDTGELGGLIEVIDGRWGASLEMNPDPTKFIDVILAIELPPAERRPAPLLLYDLWNDPLCLHSLHEERPDLVEHYTAFLEAQWEAHQALAQQFTPGEESPLTPEQLRTLRALGYIR